MNRRTFVASTGAGLGAAMAGCLSDGTDPTPGSTPSDDEEDPSETPDESIYAVALEGDPLADVGEFATLAVELVDPHVESDSPAALEATLTNTTDGTVAVSSGAPWPFGVVWAEPAGDGESITLWSDAYEESGHVGTDGKRVGGVNDIGVIEDLEGGASVARTFELHEETPGLEVGTYEASISCGVEPEDANEGEGLEVGLALSVEEGGSEPDDGSRDEDVVPEEPRVDEPPYEIEEPEAPDGPRDEDEWDDRYLGAEMPEEPSLEFEALPGVRVAESALSIADADGDRYAVHLVGAAERDEALDLERADDDVRERVREADFDERLLVVVESGFGSGSVGHRWKRVEAVDDGVHLHGYYTDPLVRTDDLTVHQSAVLVDRPDGGDVDLARVSLTIDAETRVHVNSTEGVVTTDTANE